MEKLRLLNSTSRYFGLATLLLVIAVVLKIGLAYADPTHTISGTVNFNGNPVPADNNNNQVSVEFGAADGSGASGSTGVNGSGQYSISGLPDETYYDSIQTISNKFNSATTGAPNTFFLNASGSTTTTIGGSDVTQNFSFTTKRLW